jgi:hypothetical protein
LTHYENWEQCLLRISHYGSFYQRVLLPNKLSLDVALAGIRASKSKLNLLFYV